MQPASFLLMLIAVKVSVPVNCAPRFQDSDQLLQPQHTSFKTETYEDTPAGHFYLSGSRRKGVHKPFLVILPLRTDTSNFVSIFDLRRKRFLCMDSEGELYNSWHKDRDDCLFQRIWLNFENRRDVFYSTSGGRLLQLKAAELELHHEPPEPPLGLFKRFEGLRAKRQRRSEEVNPSDPLRSESHPSPSGKDHIQDADPRLPEQDQAGAVSKETITSCDDPLSVIQSNGPASPVKTNIAERAEQD